MQQQRTKAAFGWISPVNQMPIQDDLMEKALSQVFGLLIVTAFTPQVAIDRLPVSIEQQADQGTVPVATRLDAFDEGPVCGQKRLPHASHVCLVTTSHHPDTANATKEGDTNACLTLPKIIIADRIEQSKPE
jgi:hypothetical protein